MFIPSLLAPPALQVMYSPPTEWNRYLESIQESEDISAAFQNIDVHAFDDKGFAAIHAATVLNRCDIIHWLLNKKVNTEVETRDSQSTPLHLAAWYKKTEAVKLLISRGASTHATNKLGASPLHFAADRNSPDIITILVKSGADINAQCLTGKTPLHYAVKSQSCSAVTCLLTFSPSVDIKEREYYYTSLHIAAIYNTPEIIAALLQAGADPNLQNKHGFSPFHIATERADSSTFKAFIESGADIDAKTGNGMPPLLLAAVANRIESVSLLLKSGANKDVQSHNGSTILHYRQVYESEKLASLLLQAHAGIGIKNKEGLLPIHVAAQYASAKTIEEFICCSDVNSKAEDGRTALHVAAAHNRVDIINLLIKNRADINATESRGATPLIVAIYTNKADAAKALLNQGANIEIAAFKSSLKALHIAAKQGFLLLTKLLLDYKARIDTTAPYKRTPLHLAVAFGHKEIVEELLQRKANVNAQDAKGHAPLHFAADTRNFSLVKLLITNNANVNISDKKGQTPLHFAVLLGEGGIAHTLITAGADANAMDENGNTPLHLAASRKHLEAATALLSCDTIDREVKNSDGRTPLCMAAAAGGLEMFTLLRSNGASVEAEHLPHAACEGDNLDIIEAIFDKGRFQKTDSAGRTPLMIALLHHSSQVVRFLDVHGIRPSFSEEDLDPSTARGRENIKLWDRWRDFEEAKRWEIDPSHLSWEIPIPAKPDSDLLTTWKNTLKALESDKPSSVSLTDEEHPWFGLNRIVTYTAKRMHEGIASIPSDPVEKKRFFDKIEGVLHYVFTAGHSKVNLSIYCRQLDDSGRACGENWLHHTRQVYIQAARDLGDLPDPPSKENIERLFSDEAVQTALVNEAITLLLAAHDLQQRAFEREVIRYAGSRTPSDAHTIGLCARAFGDLFPLLDHQALPTDRVTTTAELLQLRKYRDEVKARLDESYSPCDIFWLAREHILLKNRDSDVSEIVGWECWDKAQSEGTIDPERRSELSGLLNSKALVEFLVFLKMITPKQDTCAIS